MRSFRRPGVATIMCAVLSAVRWASLGTPPYTQTVEREAGVASCSIWVWIWTASSRVGETMTALAGEWDFGTSGDEVMERMQGTPKARVLPEPVSATPITSRPERRKGQAADWMGVGLLKEVKDEESEVVVKGR